MAGEVRRAGAWALSVGADPAARRGDTREVKVQNKEASFLPVPYKWKSPSWGWVEVLPRRRQRGTRCGAFLELYMVVFFPAVSRHLVVRPNRSVVRGKAEALGEEEFVTNKGNERGAGSVPLTSHDHLARLPCPPRRAAPVQSAPATPPDRRHLAPPSTAGPRSV